MPRNPGLNAATALRLLPVSQATRRGICAPPFLGLKSTELRLLCRSAANRPRRTPSPPPSVEERAGERRRSYRSTRRSSAQWHERNCARDHRSSQENSPLPGPLPALLARGEGVGARVHSIPRVTFRPLCAGGDIAARCPLPCSVADATLIRGGGRWQAGVGRHSEVVVRRLAVLVRTFEFDVRWCVGQVRCFEFDVRCSTGAGLHFEIDCTRCNRSRSACNRSRRRCNASPNTCPRPRRTGHPPRMSSNGT